MTLDSGDGVRLRDQRAVRLRRADEDDVPAITAFYHGLSSQSSTLRFLLEHPDEMAVDQYAQLDTPSGMVSLLACLSDEPGRIAAEARYVPTEDDVAELAIAVRDDLAGLGLGTIMLNALRDHAAEQDIRRLLAVVSVVNRPMLGLLNTHGWAATHALDAGAAFLEISTDGGMPGWPQTPARRVLIEGRSWLDNDLIATLRDEDTELRRCQGPHHALGRTCPLIVSGRCQLVEDADLVVCLLPTTDPLCQELIHEQRRRWPDRFVTGPPPGWA